MLAVALYQVERHDVRMIERRHRFGFLLESLQPHRVREVTKRELDGKLFGSVE